jgi:two-component system, OmpR family, phosphate regulon sensor histidine kinase PhoR
MVDSTRRGRVLTFLVIPIVVAAVVGLIIYTLRNSFRLEQLREQSVVEATLSLANEKTDRLDKRIIEQDNAVLSLVDITDRDDFGRAWLNLSARQTPSVSSVMLVDLAARDHEVVAFATRAPALEAESSRRLLVQMMLPGMDLDAEPRTELRHLHKSHEGHSYLVSYWQREVRGRRYLLVAWHDVPRIVHDLFPMLKIETDVNSRVNVVDEDGRIVFGPSMTPGGFTVGRPFQTTLYKWQLNVTLTSAKEFGDRAANNNRIQTWLVAAAWVVVLAGLVVVISAAFRERKLSNMKSDFVANVSHELKTPLALVRMFGELLESGRVESEEKRQQYLQIILSESERLTALIENVLDFAKVERGKAAYDFVPASLKEVVARAVELCRSRAQREGIDLVLEQKEELPLTDLDERAIEIAVINLIDNAFKYAPDGKRVVVSTRLRDGLAEVRVTDQGAGIAPEDRKRIFDRFVRGNPAAVKQVRGSGIGLALVKHIAEAHGGRAWCEPVEPFGSSFVITVKLTGQKTVVGTRAQSEAPA